MRPCQRTQPTANSLQANAHGEFAGTSSIANRCYAILASLGLRSNGSAWRRVVLASLRSDIVQHELSGNSRLRKKKFRRCASIFSFYALNCAKPKPLDLMFYAKKITDEKNLINCFNYFTCNFWLLSRIREFKIQTWVKILS